MGDSPLAGSSQVLGGRMLRALGPCNFVNLGSLRFTPGFMLPPATRANEVHHSGNSHEAEMDSSQSVLRHLVEITRSIYHGQR